MNKYIWLPVIALGISAASCTDDNGNYVYEPLNKVTVSDIEGVYNAIHGITELTIDPTIKGDIYDKDLSNYEFTWHICQSSLSEDEHKHRVLSNEKVLNWKVDVPVGSYSLYLTVKDKTNGLEELIYSSLRVASSFARGFILLGTDGTDDLAQIDMLAMPASGDTTIVEGALNNDGSMRKPKRIYYTGSGNSYTEYMWLFCEGGDWKLNSIPGTGSENPAQEFDVDMPFADLGWADNEYDKNNETLVATGPGRAWSYGSVWNRNQSPLFFTEDCIYGPKTIYGLPYFAEPVNRLERSTASPLFKFYPKLFVSGTVYRLSAYSTPMFVYNTDSDVFVQIKSADYLSGTHCQAITESWNAAWRWDCGSENRRLVFGDNTNGTKSYFLMRGITTPDVYEIYCLDIQSYSQTKSKFTVDLAKAEDFDKAELYSFTGACSSIFYSVGSVLHQYNFERNLHTSVDLGDPITMLKQEFYSKSTNDDIMVATWSDANQGTFMKFEIDTNPNRIGMEIRNDFDDIVGLENPEKYLEKWPTRLKIVDAEWRTR